MLKRTSKNNINKIINQNPTWKILDIGCGYRAHKNANVIADIKDFSEHYKNKKFVKITSKELPFKDNEFDFVIASHVIEHVEDFEFFIKEIKRISSKGYIELPTKLGDNLVFENETDHIWWFSYDDINCQLIATRKIQLIEPFITVSMAKYFEEMFSDSFAIELYWENNIDYKIEEHPKQINENKISFFKIIKKYLSKRIRSIYK